MATVAEADVDGTACGSAASGFLSDTPARAAYSRARPTWLMQSGRLGKISKS